MKYYIIVGEASGDVHGAKLMKGIKDNDPQAEFRFWGGDRMVEHGGVENLVHHYREQAFMGAVEVIQHLGTIKKRLKECKEDIKNYNPEVVILIDYSGFNLKIAKYVKSIDIKVFYYILPKVWAWNESRIGKLKKYVDELFVILSFEVDYFKKHDLKVHYLGNPIVDEVEDKKRVVRDTLDEFKKNINIQKKEGGYTIALLAGSRKQEIYYNLPFMVKLANSMPESRFLLAGVSWLEREQYEKYLSKSIGNIELLTDKTYEILLSSDGAVVTSGTATLETALLGIPEVVVYKCASITYFLGSFIIRKIHYISLSNLMFKRICIDEFIQSRVKPHLVRKGLLNVIEEGERRKKLLEDYKLLSEMAGKEGSSERVAK
ncbi:MAG: lipid-A-disaccharide synthase, partial [Bacteroidetes bacterium]|nr:lipid-A-disaccharide synthase [Bacteroidota bacterium]